MSDEVVNAFASNVPATLPTTAIGVATSMAREKYELESLFTVAQHMGRDELEGHEKLMKSCARPTFADGCEYSYPIGGQEISGPSVKLAVV